MIKNYGTSKDLSYLYRNLVQEESEKKKGNNDSDNLIDIKANQLISNVPYYDKVINDPTLPKYISDFISFKQDMKLLEIKYSELQASQEKRLMTQFNIDEQKALSKNINKISYQLGKDLKNLEKNLQIYTSSDISDNDESENTTNFLQHQIKENMNQNLISQFFIFSKKFKLNQEIYSKKCKELLIEDDEDDNENNNIYEMNEISTTNSEGNDNIQKANNDQNFLMKDEPDILLKERDNELDKIVKGVNNLHEMFKDMTILVNEQGTILDRIDYNIDIGYDNVSKGKKKLNQANESKKGSCFRNAIMILMLFVFIEAMLLLNKFL